MGAMDDRRPACVLRPVRKKTEEGIVQQTDFINIPKQFDSYIFISKSKACYLGRKPSTSKVTDQHWTRACVPEAWQSVSALHAILKWKDGKLFIEDRSSNGTWVGKVGKDSGEGEDDYRRLLKGKEEGVPLGSYIMLAQWPVGRRAEDVLIYKLETVPAEAGNVNERSAIIPSRPSSMYTSSINTPAPSVGKPVSVDKMEPCKMCKEQTDEALKAKKALTEEKNQHERVRREKEKVDKELVTARKEVETLKKSLTEAKKKAEAEKKKYDTSVKAKQDVDAELQKTKKHNKELKDQNAANDKLRANHMRDSLTPLIATIKQLKEQNTQNRADVAKMHAELANDAKAMDDVMKTHTLNRGNEALLKEHEEEITAMQRDQRRVEREAAAWRLKAEAYATKLPDELNCVLNSHLPNLVQECIDKVHARVVALNAATASQLLGPDASAGPGMTHAGDEERAAGADLSQRTVLSGHACANSTPEQPTPMARDGEAAARTAGPDSQLTASQGAVGASVSLKGLVNGSQGASPGGPAVAGPAGGLKRTDVAAEPAEQGDGKRRRVGSARTGAYDSPENHSQVNTTSNGNGKQTDVHSQQDRKTPGAAARKSTGKDSSGPGDLMKKLAALPKSHEGMDF